jgi:cytochrome b561
MSAGMTSHPFDATDVNETQFQFDRALRWLHWAMALLIFAALGVGAVSASLPAGQQPRKELLEIHKSLGFTILVLVFARLAWRLWSGEPPYRKPLGRLTHWASRAGHVSLYGMMIFMPISGYLYSAAGGYSLPWFGLFQWPRLLSHDTELSDWGELLHDRGAWVIAAVVLLHLAAVGWHRWIKRDEVLSRMTG